MNWSAFERRWQNVVSPRWLESCRVRRIRGALIHPTTVSKQHRRLFVDVSVISKHDAATGIQRIVRAVASELLKYSSDRWDIYPVEATRKRSYYLTAWPSGDVSNGCGYMEGRPGDVFLGLDFALDTIRFHRKELMDFKKNGGLLWFVMYDLLPVQRPDWFSDKLVVRFRKWLGVLAAIADGFYCISEPVESELRQELNRLYGLRDGFETKVVPMGWDLAGSMPSKGLPEGFDLVLQEIAKRPTALMVGTLEPRKGHIDVVAAFECLWKKGGDFGLVIVGRPGWKTVALQTALRAHPERGGRLFWLDNISDEALMRLYDACTGIIIASYGEGFGLPLIEALGNGKPVLARDIPIFRLHEEKGVHYFDVNVQPEKFARLLDEWLINKIRTNLQVSTDFSSWANTAESIFAHLNSKD